MKKTLTILVTVCMLGFLACGKKGDSSSAAGCEGNFRHGRSHEVRRQQGDVLLVLYKLQMGRHRAHAKAARHASLPKTANPAAAK
jgi:hypothetical protein